MKLIEIEIENKNVLIERSFIGKETVFIDDTAVHKKWNFLTTNHNFKINDTDYNIKYVYKDGWKKLIGNPIFQLTSNENIISEYQVKNKPYLLFQFGIGITSTYIAMKLIFLVIESAKYGFVFDAH